MVREGGSIVRAVLAASRDPVATGGRPHADGHRVPVARSPFGPIDALRVLLYLALLVTALLAPGGRYLFVVAGAVSLTSVVLSLTRRSRPLSLIPVWELGFVLLIVVEGATEYREIVAAVGGDNYAAAARFLVAANCAVVLGHAAVFRAARFSPVPTHRWVFRRDHAIAFLAAVTLLFWMVELPWVLYVLRNGREGFGFGPSSLVPLVEGFVSAAGLTLPSLYVFTVTRVFHARMRWAVLLSLPVLAAHFVVGTRYPMLFAIAGMFVVRWGTEPLKLRTWLRAALLVVVVALAMSLMLQFRARGLGNLSPSELISDLAADGVDTSEAIVLTQGRLVDWYTTQPHLDGRSTSSLFVFWVPRSVWAGKPTLLEYWFPREYGLRGFPENHSIAAGFGADGYADGGFAGGMLAALVTGLALGATDRATSRVLVDRGSPYLVLVGPLFGACFFAVRSLNTAIIASVGAVLLAWLFQWAIAGRREPLDGDAPPHDDSTDLVVDLRTAAVPGRTAP